MNRKSNVPQADAVETPTPADATAVGAVAPDTGGPARTDTSERQDAVAKAFHDANRLWQQQWQQGLDQAQRWAEQASQGQARAAEACRAVWDGAAKMPGVPAGAFPGLGAAAATLPGLSLPTWATEACKVHHTQAAGMMQQLADHAAQAIDESARLGKAHLQWQVDLWHKLGARVAG